ncbi:hypothetical protein SSP35_01_04250 [Streptomyces sp. NBRC 110611]|uniref:hypothetical protein n=1 Tax=Streptomyces sp. NBRC 110611 TaxID=1621259 RepID=UPI000829B1D4|nr:hypothetical protein [Streptomyces sp. NBRC 110611]GAU65088.1 hypothetical protein SSP35_01_04250 [Streptomyces sp. NBRC 110611]
MKQGTKQGTIKAIGTAALGAAFAVTAAGAASAATPVTASTDATGALSNLSVTDATQTLSGATKDVSVTKPAGNDVETQLNSKGKKPLIGGLPATGTSTSTVAKTLPGLTH